MKLICEYDLCKLILERPIVLPCGRTVCQSHLDKTVDQRSSKSEFTCLVCKAKHRVPEDGLFPQNHIVARLIDSHLLLSDLHRSALATLNELANELSQFERHVASDPFNYIYDHFASIRNSIDLHREEMIKKISDKSDQLVEQLNEIEKKCAANLANVKKVDPNPVLNSLIQTTHQELRNPFLDEKKLAEKIDHLKAHLNAFRNSIALNKRSLVMGYSIHFEIKNTDQFGELIMEKTTNGKLVDVLCEYVGHANTITDLEVTRDMRFLISVSDDRSIRIWNFQTGQTLKYFENAHTDTISTIKLFASKYKLFVTGSLDQTCKIWSLIEPFGCTRTLDNKQGVGGMCVLADKIFACGLANGRINIWNLDDLQHSFQAHKDHINILKVQYKCKKNFLSSSISGSIKLWNVEGKCLREFHGQTKRVNSIEFLSSQIFLTCSTDESSIKYWNIKEEKCYRVYQLSMPIQSIKWVYGELLAIAYSNPNHCNLFDLILFNFNTNEFVEGLEPCQGGITKLYNLISRGLLLTVSNSNKIKLRYI